MCVLRHAVGQRGRELHFGSREGAVALLVLLAWVHHSHHAAAQSWPRTCCLPIQVRFVHG